MVLRIAKSAIQTTGFICLALAGYVNAQDRIEDDILGSSDLPTCDFFGRNVAVSGEWIFPSGYTCDAAGVADAGTVEVFGRTLCGYERFEVLRSDMPIFAEAIGESGMDASGDTLIVASPNYPGPPSPLEGTVHVFHFDGSSWKYEAGLEQGAFVLHDDFARRNAISEDSIFVGSVDPGPLQPNGTPSYRGETYIYQKVNGVWTLKQIWKAPDEPRVLWFRYRQNYGSTRGYTCHRFEPN